MTSRPDGARDEGEGRDRGGPARSDAERLPTSSRSGGTDDAPRLEEERRSREQSRELHLLGTALDATDTPLVITDREGAIEWVNPAFTRATGYSEEEALGRNPGELLRSGVHDDEFYADLWKTILAGEGWSGRIVNRRKDGTLYPEEQTITPVRDPDGEITHFVAVKADVSDRVAAEEEEARRTERLRLQADLLEAVGQAAIATDPEGRVIYWNRAAEELYGWTAEEALGSDILELTPTETSRDQAAKIMERLRRGESWTGNFEVRRKDGSTFPALVTDSPLLDEEGNVVGIVGVSSDLTEMRELEARLRQAQKMEAVGQLAGGVAHDFNNVLTVIQGQAEILLTDLNEDAEARQGLEEVLQAARHAASLTRRLLAFGRKQVLMDEVLELDGVLEGTKSMLTRLLPERIELRFERAEEPVFVRADPSQLEQVVMNLAVNAADAIRDGGTITFRVDSATVTADDLEAVPWTAEPGRYARLTVEDTGEGMEPEVVERIFEPFFTTKSKGKGTGLGLAVVFGVVKQSGGQILVESEPDEGTSFQVLLPLASEDAGEGSEVEKEARRAVKARESSAVNGGEPRSRGRSPRTALLVEDEPSVRAVARRVLERGGCSVLCAGNGEEALELCGRHGDSINVVVSDIVMPEMGGEELVDLLRERLPGVPIVLMSGYSDGEVAAGVRSKASAFLEKPFSPEDLLELVDGVLEG